jgi:hypothetical protein
MTLSLVDGIRRDNPFKNKKYLSITIQILRNNYPNYIITNTYIMSLKFLHALFIKTCIC